MAEAEPDQGSGAGAGNYIDTSVLDAIQRGVPLHGYTENTSAWGIQDPFERHQIIFEQRLQLEFESDVQEVRVVGKPQLIYDLLKKQMDVEFRELYASRDYKSVDVSVGEKIETWGVTDFWPVVDLLNPRTYFTVRNWRPIDEKLPTPVVESHILAGPATFHAVVMPFMGLSQYQLDPSQPFALPVPPIPGATIVQTKPHPALSNVGGGVRTDLNIGDLKFSVYGAVARDPLPAVFALPNIAKHTATFVVDNDRVAMAAASLQTNVSGAIFRAEAAYYDRLDDECAGKDLVVLGVPECFYLRRVPTARANISIEHKLFTGLDAHLQLISENTRSADIPRLPSAAKMMAPGFPQQVTWNRIVTLRLQGDFLKSDFRPMAFAYWSLDDQSYFVNTDFEYHLADGFALALGVFYFHGYASDPNKNKYTFAGGLAGSSNVYLRATAWF